MDRLNYHHLRYFREVAREGNLTRAAAKLNLSQSALSAQIRQLEDRLERPLFDRVGRRLDLTEAGRIALDHADRIFSTGAELLATLARGGEARPPLRVGSLSTLSRNFQIQFLRPVVEAGDADIAIRSGGAAELYEALRSLALDVVLTTAPPEPEQAAGLTAHRLDEQPVALHGAPRRVAHPTLRDLIAAEPLILPTEHTIRSEFLGLVTRLGVTPRIVADVDDMAMIRLLTKEDVGVAIAPAVVLRDELRSGLVATAPFDLDIMERFYAVTAERSFPHPVIDRLIRSPKS